MKYEEAIRATWNQNDLPTKDDEARLRSLVRYGTLAPSSHNTQCELTFGRVDFLCFNCTVLSHIIVHKCRNVAISNFYLLHLKDNN